MIILGIDPGIADTGYGVIKQEGSNLTCLDYGSIQTSSKLVLVERLGILYQELAGIITKYQPERVAIEQLFFCKNVKTAMVVGQARGVVLLTCQQAQVPTVEFTPLQVKQAVAAYGGAGKMQVQKMVKILLHLNDIPRPDDAADALAIAICAANSTKIPV